MTAPSLQVLTVTEHDDGHFDARENEWYPSADQPVSDTLADVVVDSDSLQLTDEIAMIQNLAEGLHEDHHRYLDWMHAADYESGMEFDAWQQTAARGRRPRCSTRTPRRASPSPSS